MRFEVSIVDLSRIWAQKSTDTYLYSDRSWKIWTPNRSDSLVLSFSPLLTFFLPTLLISYLHMSDGSLEVESSWAAPVNQAIRPVRLVDNRLIVNISRSILILWLVIHSLPTSLRELLFGLQFLLHPVAPWFSAVLYTLRELSCIWLHITTFPTSDTLWLWTTWYVPQRSWTSAY